MLNAFVTYCLDQGTVLSVHHLVNNNEPTAFWGDFFKGFPLVFNGQFFFVESRAQNSLPLKHEISKTVSIAHAGGTKQRNSYLSKDLAHLRISECNKTISEARENLQERISRSTTASNPSSYSSLLYLLDELTLKRCIPFHKGGKFLKKLWCCVGGNITR